MIAVATVVFQELEESFQSQLLVTILDVMLQPIRTYITAEKSGSAFFLDIANGITQTCAEPQLFEWYHPDLHGTTALCLCSKDAGM